MLGGTGQTHDWSVSAEFVRRSDKPVFLAGGLNPKNVSMTIRKVRAHGVDICSGIRRHRKLDPALLYAFIEEVRKAGHDTAGAGDGRTTDEHCACAT